MSKFDGIADERFGKAHGRRRLDSRLRTRPHHRDAAAGDERDDIDEHKDDQQLRAHRAAVPQSAQQ